RQHALSTAAGSPATRGRAHPRQGVGLLDGRATPRRFRPRDAESARRLRPCRDRRRGRGGRARTRRAVGQDAARTCFPRGAASGTVGARERRQGAGPLRDRMGRTVLSGLTLQHLFDHPLTDDQGQVDSVMRVNYDVDQAAFAAVAALTVGELKNHLLRSPGAEVERLGRGLTGVMAAAVAKLCDVHELIFVARKITHATKARTLLGSPGTLSSRLQPNHPTDDLRGITLLTFWGLSLGSGDALVGLNPAVDTVENVSGILRHLDALRRRTGA